MSRDPVTTTAARKKQTEKIGARCFQHNAPAAKRIGARWMCPECLKHRRKS